MTAPDLSAIRAQLAGITPGPWIVRRHDLSLYVEAESGELNPINLGYVGNRPERDAAFIAAAPSTVAQLLGIVERVEALAAVWEARGEHDMAYSKTIPDEDIAMAILTDGAEKVEAARHIRNAIKGES